MRAAPALPVMVASQSTIRSFSDQGFCFLVATSPVALELIRIQTKSLASKTSLGQLTIAVSPTATANGCSAVRLSLSVTRMRKRLSPTWLEPGVQVRRPDEALTEAPVGPPTSE